MNQCLKNLAFAACLLALASCASTKGSKADRNTSRAQFLDEVWVSPSLNGKAVSDSFTRVYFTPVSVGRLKEQGWWASQNTKSKAQLDADARELANYMHEALVTAVYDYPNKRMRLASQPGPGTLTIETAITELVPAKAFWNAAATAAGFVVPGAGLLRAAGKGAIGIEGRLVDGNTGAVLSAFRHRDTDKFAVVNIASYKWYAGSEANIDDLAKRSAIVLNTPSGTVVKSASPIKLVAF